MKKNKINVVTLGCSKNIVDSEHLMAQLSAAGYELTYDSNSTDAKVVVINTCGFIGDAKEESINTILGFANAKTAGKIEKLYVIGCLSERYADQLRAEIPEVDSFFGAKDLLGIAKELGAESIKMLRSERILTTPPHYAYLKISEGCNWGCSYCAIPLIRGKHISVPMEELLEEAQKLADKGVRELMVIAQDTTYYGMDLYGKRRLALLLEKLCEIKGIEWIRLHYAYPTQFPDDVIDVMAREPKICKYLDIPLQHISDSQLKAMHRGITKAQSYALIEKLRSRIPDIAIRTTMLVGFPGESQQDFMELMQFVGDVRFDRLGVFPYSEEEDTYSALTFEDDISEQEKAHRVEQIMELQSIISRENNLKRVGTTQKVIVDSLQGEYYVARSQYDSAEVDQEILIEAEKGILKVGEFYTVMITDASEYDLYADIL